MGRNQTSAIAVAALTMLFLACASAQSPASAPMGSRSPASAPTVSGSTTEAPTAEAPVAVNDCFNSILNMSDCLTFVEMGSTVTKPDKMCCPELAGLVESNPICLCQLLGNSSSIGIQIDLNKALTLPTVCKVTTPPVSLCSAIGIPVGAPMASEGPAMSVAGLVKGLEVEPRGRKFDSPLTPIMYYMLKKNYLSIVIDKKLTAVNFLKKYLYVKDVGAPAVGGGMPAMTPDTAPRGNGGVRSIRDFSQVIIVGLSSAAVAILF